MKKLLVYTNWVLIVLGCKAAEDMRRPSPLRRLITRSITIEDIAAEREAQEEQRRKAAEEQLLEPNSPPIPPLPSFPAPVLPPVVLPTVIDMQPGQGSPRPMPRTPSPGSPRAPRRRLAVVPYSSYQPMTPPGEESPNSADMSPSPRPVTPEDPHARAVVQSVFLRLMEDADANLHEENNNNDEAPL